MKTAFQVCEKRMDSLTNAYTILVAIWIKKKMHIHLKSYIMMNFKMNSC